MAQKQPAIQFYFGDWKKDAELSMCSLSTKGFWFELLGAMHELGRSGQITGTAQQLARVCRCTAAEAEEAIRELAETRTATVMERNGVFTIVNRRMKRENKEREQSKERVQKFRKKNDVTLCSKKVTDVLNVADTEDKAQKRNGNGNVTPYSSSSSSNNVTNVTNTEFGNSAVCEVFAHWQTVLSHPNAKLTKDRKAKIQARLKDGYSVSQLKLAVDGCFSSPFHRGENDQGMVYDDIDLIFRNGEKVEKFISLVKKQADTDTKQAQFCRKCDSTNGLIEINEGWTRCRHEHNN